MLSSSLPDVVHSRYVIPLNSKGKIHDAFGFGPLTVEQIEVPFPVMKMRCSYCLVIVHFRIMIMSLNQILLEYDNFKFQR